MSSAGTSMSIGPRESSVVGSIGLLVVVEGKEGVEGGLSSGGRPETLLSLSCLGKPKASFEKAIARRDPATRCSNYAIYYPKKRRERSLMSMPEE